MKNRNLNFKSIIYICLLTLIITIFLIGYIYNKEGSIINIYTFIAVFIIAIMIETLAILHNKIIQKSTEKIIKCVDDMAEGRIVTKYNNHNLVHIDKIGQAVNNLSDVLSKERCRQADFDRCYIASNNIIRFMDHVKEIFTVYPKNEYSIIKFDIDKFEYINEIYGYSCGDKILKDIANTLSCIVNEREIYTKGYDDNFMILLHEINDEEIIKKIKYISKKFEQIVDENGKKINIHFTFGIYKIEENIETVEKMIDRASVAQKIAKIEANKMESYMFYNSNIKNKIIEEKKMENIMYEALENNEFEVYLQGKNDLNSSEFSGAEALVRWNSSELGFVSPSDFIPLFERNGFIIEIDFYVFEEICKNIRKWLNDGVEVKITSINQSKRHLENKDYVDRMKNIIDKYSIPAQLIELEITETAVIDNVDRLVEVIDDLHKLGFKISIDDFGSGYSSLNMLKQINADVLKIDREFLNEVNESKKSKTIIKHVIKMAKELNIQTITEGVETHEQEEFLKNIGCDMAQGFLFSKPMPIKEFEKKYYY